jgi:hypothetical protein
VQPFEPFCEKPTHWLPARKTEWLVSFMVTSVSLSDWGVKLLESELHSEDGRLALSGVV